MEELRIPPLLSQLVMMHGASPHAPQLRFDLRGMTLFVGPNNSGKSLALKEIERVLGGEDLTVPAAKKPNVRSVVSDVEIAPLGNVAARALIESRRFTGRDVETPDGIQIFTLRPARDDAARVTGHVLNKLLAQVAAVSGDNGRPRPRDILIYLQQFVSLLTLRLDGATRMELTAAAKAYDLRESPRSLQAAIFGDGVTRELLSRLVHDAFGWHLVVDPTAMATLRFRLSRRAQANDAESCGLGRDACAFHDRAVPIEDFSDGVKSYVGILAALLASGCRILLIDEPDAFLHPPLARRLGRVLSDESARRGLNLFAATHSEHFLAGCAEAAGETNVVRLTYRNDVASARLLPAADIRTLLRDPLLRSADVLSALFHEGAVVCEADGDRAFYQEIDTRLAAHGDARATVDAVFLNAQNKQTIPRIVGPLRQLGIPAAAVVDFDFLRDDDTKHLLKVIGLRDVDCSATSACRAALTDAVAEEGLDIRGRGLAALSGTLRADAQRVIETLAAHGVFVVPVGELERWCAELGVGARKDRWLAAIFQRMGDDPASPGYVSPAPGDVWDFLGRISAWLADPARRGMPA